MRFDIRKALVAIILASLGTLIACGGSGKSVSSPSASAQLSLSPAALTYAAVVGDGPYTVNVTASKGLPVAADTFTATSSNPAVASTTLNGSSAIISPVGVGTANIVFTSGSGVTKTIAVTIAANKTQIVLSPVALTYAARAGDASYSVSVKAVKSDGVTADTFTVASSNTAVITTSVSVNVVTITPVGAGTANIVFTSGSSSKVTSTIAATIGANLTQLSLSPAALSYTAVAGSTPYTVTVTAVKSDGVTPDTFTVASSNTAIAATSVNGNVVTITPVAPGTANIVFSSGSSSKVTRTIAATISAAIPSPQLSLAPPALTYTAAVGDTPYLVTVTAIKNDGATADSFTAISGDSTVATASQSGKVVTITPVASGTASIVIASGDGLSSTIVATITAKANSSRLSLSPAALTYTAAVGDAPYPVTVTAVKNDGITTDTFTAVSSNPAAATASVSGSVVTITPVAAGTADVVFTTGAGLTSTIVVTITGQGLSRCDGTEWFCDDFQSGNSNNWVLTPSFTGSAFTVIADANVTGNQVLQYTAGTGTTAPGSVIALIGDSAWAKVKNQSDYYVEARIKPQNNTTTGNKQIYLVGRYQDPTDWYFGGLNVQSSTASTKVEAGYMKAGTISKPSATLTPIILGGQGGTDGQWYTVHYEMIGGVQTVYLDGVQMPSVTDLTFGSGRFGLFTYNRSFLIDDIRVGAVQLALTPNTPTYAAAAGSAPYSVTVTAIMGDGVSADTFTASSSNTAVVTTSVSSNVVTLTPVGMGTANIVFTSGSNSKVIRSITATISAAASGTPQLTLSPATLTYTAIAGSAPYSVSVTAVKNDGVTADTFTVASSNTAAATTSVSGNVVTITPVAAGTANVVFTSGSNLTTTIVATITANLSQVTLSPAALTYTAVAGSTPYSVTVTAVKSNGSTADTFTVASSSTAVASTSVSGNVVTITPLAAGTSNIVFTSGSGVTSTIVATITANLANVTFSPAALSYTATVGSTPYSVTVTAVKSDGLTADTFTVASGNTAVATVLQTGNAVAITPVAVGTANIVFTSGSGVTSTIVATISTDLTQISLVPPAATYTAPVGSDPYLVTVKAVKSDGVTGDTFTPSSSDTTVATVSASANVVTITPVGVGTCTITITSGSGLTTAITVTVLPSASALTLTPPTTSYTSNTGGAPHIVIISAAKADGITPDTFTVSANDNGTVATTAVTDDQLTITPVAVGTSHITITSGSGKTATITLTVNSAVSHCDGTEWFCDDFQGETVSSTTVANWDLNTTPGGTFKVVQDADNPANTALQYSFGTETAGAVISQIKDTVWQTAMSGHTGDYYVEAHLKPQQIGHNKQLYLVSHYTDANNYYGGGYNYSGPRLETASESNGVFTAKFAQGTNPNSALPAAATQGAGAGKEGTWVTVRFEVVNGTSTMYVNGVADSKTVKKFPALLASGKIGIYTDYNNFLIDDIRVGDASQKPAQPAQLTVKSAMGVSVTAYTAEVGDAVTPVTVTALKGDGTTDTYYAASSNPAVITATVDPADSTGKTVDLTPVSPGTANIVFFSASDPNVSVTVSATVGPQFVQPTATYSLSDGQLLPSPGAMNAYIDDHLVLTFDSMPTLKGTGSVRIFKSTDDTLVDVIPLTGATDLIGQNYSSNVRAVKTNPVWISGNSVVIAPHQSKLLYDTSYYVAVSDGSITGTLSSQNFTGIGKVGGWTFTTKDAPASGLTTLAVNVTGTAANFRTVQGALNYLMQSAPTVATTINVANGTYQELMFLRNLNNVTINGESESGTIIQYENYDSFNTGSGGSSSAGSPSLTGGRAVFLVEGSDMLTLTNLTLKNTHIRKSSVSANQAETIYFNSDLGRLIAMNAEFDSEQDTLLLKGYNWFYKTLITGNVDYIWGYSHSALFEESEIRTVGDSSSSSPSGGYLVQARVPSLSDKGFVFLNSNLTYGAGPSGQVVANGTNAAASTYLARSGGGSGAYDNVLFINCKMDTHIAPLGWAAPNINSNPSPIPPTATATSGWRESGSINMLLESPLDVSGRSANSSQMTTTDITTNNYDTRAHIFSGFNSGAGWNPLP